MSQKYEKLKSLLKELFQLDQPDLDFGLYRIMHAKSAEVSQFLDKDLLPQVKTAFGEYKTADKASLEKDLATAIGQATALGADPESLPKVKELRAKLATEAVDINSLENEVYDHLFSFFRRYYSEGDFLSKRVYKPGVYAIPYGGEEVKLHWANADQYYIKTSEYLRDYAFRLRPNDATNPMRVHFRLVDAAEGEHGNVKEAEGKARVFVLSRENTLSLETGEQGPELVQELVIAFEYRPATLSDWPGDLREGKAKPPAQKDLLEAAEKAILAATDPELADWLIGLRMAHVKADGTPADYSRLRAHLNRYAARNTFDYFIHKDLGGFLRRELDFYVKNEVMHLDDIENESAPRVEQYLSKIKVIRKIAGKIITFLAQLEDFQKKLWLKKKFVVETRYCIRVGCIPESFYPEICTNDAQREEWVKLCAIDEIKGTVGDMFTPGTPGHSDPLKPEFLKANPSLMVDTGNFSGEFCQRLVEAMGDLDEKADGVLIHSENFQALSFLGMRYHGTINSIYIDPPYNTDGSPILYKNGYRSSSWVSLVEERIGLGERFLAHNGVLCVTIDDYQQKELAFVVESLCSQEQILGTVAIRINPSGRITQNGLAVTHEYAIFSGNSSSSSLGRLSRSEDQIKRFKGNDDDGIFEWRNFRREGSSSERGARPRRHFPIYCSINGIRIPKLEWVEGTRSYLVLESPTAGERVVYPTDSKGTERVWRWGLDRISENMNEIEARPDESGSYQIYYKYRPSEEGILAPSIWVDSKYSATEHGTGVLKNLFGERNSFSFPKSLYATSDCLRLGAGETDDALILDFFGGSGTTGHAVIFLNRGNGERRKFILIEMAEYFDTVLLPRLKKVTFTPEWKDGKPKRLATAEEAERSPRIMKVLRLESYEDTLNNLDLRRSEAQTSLLTHPDATQPDGLREQYLLRYMLEVESRGSQSLLNIAAFTDPTAYRLKVKKPGSDESREVNVDLVETFNWLIGLTVQHLAAPQTFAAEFQRDSEGRLRVKERLKLSADGPYWFRTVTGTTPDGRKALVIWRKLTGDPERDNLALDEWFTKQGYSSKDSEFDLIYVNGGNNLENLKTPDDRWKVRLIEEDFHRLMFATEGV